MASQKALPSLWVWRRLNTVWIAVGFFLLGQACFSGWSLIVSFSGCSSILPLFCLFDSLSRCFCHLSRAGRPVLNDFRSLAQDYLFNNLVAQFVGYRIWKGNIDRMENNLQREAQAIRLLPLVILLIWLAVSEP